MNKNEIINNIKFKENCAKYGVDSKECEIFYFNNEEYVILLTQPILDIYILFDKNYNTIWIDKCDFINDDEDLKNFVEYRYTIYSNLQNLFPFLEKFNYPFECYSLKEIIDLSSIIDLLETNEGYPLSTRINQVWYDRDKNNDYLKMLSYIKFLGEQIKLYFMMDYHMKTMGFDLPNVYEYINKLIDSLNEYIDYCLKNNKDIDLNKLGFCKKIKNKALLQDVADILIMKNKDLSTIANLLLELLNSSDFYLDKIIENEEEIKTRLLLKKQNRTKYEVEGSLW